MKKSVRVNEETIHRYGSQEVKRTHPAFGMIGANRITGNVQLFGSSIIHSGSIRITIHEAEETISLGGVHHPFAHKIVAEVELSEAQWATFVSAMNIGSGVPCTLRYSRNGEGLIDYPYIEDDTYEAKRAKDIGRSIKEKNELLIKAVARLDAMIESGKVSKTELKAIRSLFIQPVDHMESNGEFAAKLLTEHSEILVKDAKAEIEAYVLRTALQFPQLTQNAEATPLVTIEDKSK